MNQENHKNKKPVRFIVDDNPNNKFTWWHSRKGVYHPKIQTYGGVFPLLYGVVKTPYVFNVKDIPF